MARAPTALDLKEFASAGQLDAVRDLLAGSGVEHELRQPARGREPADELLDAAGETDAALVVIGIRRRSPVVKLILGSSAQRVLLEAALPGPGREGARPLRSLEAGRPTSGGRCR